MDNQLLTKKGTIRKRAPKKKIEYFTEETEDAILQYVESTNEDEKNKIYDEKIKNAFLKLTENIIHTYKFYYTEVDSISDLQQEIIVFLLERLHLYKKSKGKAYSYFGTITKRYLIFQNDKNYKKRVQKIDIADVQNNEEYHDIDSNLIHKDEQNALKREFDLDFMDAYIEHISANMEKYFPENKKNKKSNIKDTQIADIILELFRKRNQIDIFNKKALYHSIKEMIHINTNKNVTTLHISYVANVMASLYKELYFKYQNYEYPFNNIEENIFI